MAETNLTSLMNTTIDKLKTIVSGDTVIGDPIILGEITIIPVSKITLGVATGGSDIPNKQRISAFGGGGGAGLSVTPICFLAVKEDDVKILNIAMETTPIDSVINAAPDLFNKIKDLFKKDKG